MEDFNFTPPVEQQSRHYDIPTDYNAAMMLQLINIKIKDTTIPEHIKKQLINIIEPFIINASMTQVSRGEVLYFISMFEELWMDFIIFKCPKRNDKDLEFIRTLCINYLIQQYNKSIDGWQGNHVFEKKQTYDVKQTSQEVENDQGGFFRNKRKHRKYVEMEEE